MTIQLPSLPENPTEEELHEFWVEVNRRVVHAGYPSLPLEEPFIPQMIMPLPRVNMSQEEIERFMKLFKDIVENRSPTRMPIVPVASRGCGGVCPHCGGLIPEEE